MGRPTIFTDALADEICERIMDGESLRSICADEHMPGRTTVHRWMADVAGFSTRCARAREIQADTLFDDMQNVADEGNPEDVQRAKLRVSTMQWRASKLSPKKYGDRQTIEHEGLDTRSDEEIAARIAALQAKRDAGQG